MTRQTRHYSPAEIARAVGLALVAGDERASRELNVPRRTVAGWRTDPRNAPLVEKSREDMARELWRGVEAGVRSVIDGFADPTASLRDRAIAFGILMDKHAILTGGVTARTAVVGPGLTDGLDDAERLALRDLLEALPAGGRSCRPNSALALSSRRSRPTIPRSSRPARGRPSRRSPSPRFRPSRPRTGSSRWTR